jgi:hypothetical protein
MHSDMVNQSFGWQVILHDPFNHSPEKEKVIGKYSLVGGWVCDIFMAAQKVVQQGGPTPPVAKNIDGLPCDFKVARQQSVPPFIKIGKSSGKNANEL